ncbi:PREDICTED: EH domain-binding protein 1-like [Cyprinodon variegatus]|uniref:EH domain-binding protein 1-like n=1 Tax=Cyprinodon variegatus TaxID=28743 RepID=UPI000742BF0B|nr:PREDICTED: EH domain-binding protein 1-like [Cyprinodon variegatus]
MTSVWKRLQRVGKKAAKFQFVASPQELVIECTEKWRAFLCGEKLRRVSIGPLGVRNTFIGQEREFALELHSWQPGIRNPYRGVVVWQVPESLNITVTLFKEPTAEDYEDKDWTFVIENETKGRRKVLASADVNMKKYASSTPAQYDITLKLKPLSVKVVEATLVLNMSCIFLKEGKATDEDMQSLASLMSMKQSDIGNLDDFNDSDEEVGEERRASFGTGQSIHVAALRRPHSFHSDGRSSDGFLARSFSALVPSKARSTSSLSSPPPETAPHLPPFPDSPQTASSSPTAQSVHQKQQRETGLVPPGSLAAENPSPGGHRPSPPPPLSVAPPQLHISETVILSPSRQEAGKNHDVLRLLVTKAG